MPMELFFLCRLVFHPFSPSPTLSFFYPHSFLSSLSVHPFLPLPLVLKQAEKSRELCRRKKKERVFEKWPIWNLRKGDKEDRPGYSFVLKVRCGAPVCLTVGESRQLPAGKAQGRPRIPQHQGQRPGGAVGCCWVSGLPELRWGSLLAPLPQWILNLFVVTVCL